MKADSVPSLPSLLAFLGALGFALPGHAGTEPPVNDRPNPYRGAPVALTLPGGGPSGAISALHPDPDGRHLWVVDRCGANSCADSPADPILRLDAASRVTRSFGGGLMNAPHGLFVDQAGNVWVTDSQAGAQLPPENGKGHAVFKFSPEGKVLLVLGRPGVAGRGDGPLLNTPCHAVVGPDGTVYVADGHDGQNRPEGVARIVRFAPDGTYLSAWGRGGSGPGEFMTPHALAFDQAGNLIVADRGNNRLQVFRPDGTFVRESRRFGRPSAVAFDAEGRIYVADSESSGMRGRNPGWRPGIRVGRLEDDRVDSLIYWTNDQFPAGARPEAVTVMRDGTVYAGIVAQGGALYRFQP